MATIVPALKPFLPWLFGEAAHAIPGYGNKTHPFDTNIQNTPNRQRQTHAVHRRARHAASGAFGYAKRWA